MTTGPRPTRARWTRASSEPPALSPRAFRCRKKFLRFFPGGFADPAYLDSERGCKWEAHERWLAALGPGAFRAKLRAERYRAIAADAVAIESRTRLLFSFEKAALRDAVRTEEGARVFATGLFDFLHGGGSDAERFDRWCTAVGSLPRHKTPVITWPLVTVFGFLAQPERHVFLRPRVTRAAAVAYGYELWYTSRPGWPMYLNLLELADRVREDTLDLRPRDLIDVQSFLWVQGSSEYE